MARPRSDEARRKALEATRDLIVDNGVINLTIEDVAARSGVAKTTIYRHWPERTSLIVDAVNAMFEHLRTPDTGSLRGDLESFFGAVMHTDLSGNVGQIMPSIIEAAGRDPEMAYLLERVGSERERVCRTIIERALERGEIRAGRSPPRPRSADRRDRRTDRVPEDRAPPQAHAGVRRRLPRRRGRRPDQDLTCRPPSGEDLCHRAMWGSFVADPDMDLPQNDDRSADATEGRWRAPRIEH